jgi:type II secretory pathway component PulL
MHQTTVQGHQSQRQSGRSRQEEATIYHILIPTTPLWRR